MSICLEIFAAIVVDINMYVNVSLLLSSTDYKCHQMNTLKLEVAVQDRNHSNPIGQVLHKNKKYDCLHCHQPIFVTKRKRQEYKRSQQATITSQNKTYTCANLYSIELTAKSGSTQNTTPFTNSCNQYKIHITWSKVKE